MNNAAQHSFFFLLSLISIILIVSFLVTSFGVVLEKSSNTVQKKNSEKISNFCNDLFNLHINDLEKIHFEKCKLGVNANE